jgi:hypothetical protein
VQPSLCGKEPVLENTFPLEISKDGKRISNYEQSCDVVKVRDQGQGTYLVRSACEDEGDPYFVNELFKFTADKVVIKSVEGDNRSEFFSCAKKKIDSKKSTETRSKQNTVDIVKARCHFDYRDFNKLGKIISEVKTHSGQLVHLQYSSASLFLPVVNESRDQYADVKVPSFEKSRDRELLVHCSKMRPFAAFKEANGIWHGFLLNLPEGGASYISQAIALFGATCENSQLEADDVFNQRSMFAKRGYGNQWRPDANDIAINLESMDDILTLANQQ